MQASFSDLEYAAKKKQTPRDPFQTQLDALTPWGGARGDHRALLSNRAWRRCRG